MQRARLKLGKRVEREREMVNTEVGTRVEIEGSRSEGRR